MPFSDLVRPPIKVISVQQPWADWLVPDDNVRQHLRSGHHRSGALTLADHLPKDVENRGSGTKHRGLLAIHAMLTVDQEVIDRYRIGPASWFQRGCIIGVVDLVDVVTDSPSRWANDGRHHWESTNQRRLITPVPNRGFQGIRDLDDPIADEIHRQLDAGLYTTLTAAAPA